MKEAELDSKNLFLEEFHLYNKVDVLLIGIENYERMEKKEEKSAKKDVEEMKKLFSKKGFERIKLLENQNATKKEIENAITNFDPQELPNKSDKKLMIIYFSGNGFTKETETHQTFYLNPHDFNPTDLNSSIEIYNLKKLLESSNYLHSLILLDCIGSFEFNCYQVPKLKKEISFIENSFYQSTWVITSGETKKIQTSRSLLSKYFQQIFENSSEYLDPHHIVSSIKNLSHHQSDFKPQYGCISETPINKVGVPILCNFSQYLRHYNKVDIAYYEKKFFVDRKFLAKQNKSNIKRKKILIQKEPQDNEYELCIFESLKTKFSKNFNQNFEIDHFLLEKKEQNFLLDHLWNETKEIVIFESYNGCGEGFLSKQICFSFYEKRFWNKNFDFVILIPLSHATKSTSDSFNDQFFFDYAINLIVTFSKFALNETKLRNILKQKNEDGKILWLIDFIQDSSFTLNDNFNLNKTAIFTTPQFIETYKVKKKIEIIKINGLSSSSIPLFVNKYFQDKEENYMKMEMVNEIGRSKEFQEILSNPLLLKKICKIVEKEFDIIFSKSKMKRITVIIYILVQDITLDILCKSTNIPHKFHRKFNLDDVIEFFSLISFYCFKENIEEIEEDVLFQIESKNNSDFDILKYKVQISEQKNIQQKKFSIFFENLKIITKVGNKFCFQHKSLKNYLSYYYIFLHATHSQTIYDWLCEFNDNERKKEIIFFTSKFFHKTEEINEFLEKSKSNFRDYFDYDYKKEYFNLLIELNKTFLNSVHERNKTPLHLICESEKVNKTIVKLFIEKKSNPNSLDDKGDTPFVYLCRNENISPLILELFLKIEFLDYKSKITSLKNLIDNKSVTQKILEIFVNSFEFIDKGILNSLSKSSFFTTKFYNKISKKIQIENKPKVIENKDDLDEDSDSIDSFPNEDTKSEENILNNDFLYFTEPKSKYKPKKNTKKSDQFKLYDNVYVMSIGIDIISEKIFNSVENSQNFTNAFFDFSVYQFLDKKATRHNIFTTLKDLKNKTEKKRDLFIFHFSGKTYLYKNKTYLCLYDFDPKTPLKHSLKISELMKIVRKYPNFKHVLFVLDCDYIFNEKLVQDLNELKLQKPIVESTYSKCYWAIVPSKIFKGSLTSVFVKTISTQIKFVDFLQFLLEMQKEMYEKMFHLINLGTFLNKDNKNQFTLPILALNNNDLFVERSRFDVESEYKNYKNNKFDLRKFK